MALIVIVSILFALAILFETLGVWFRLSGSLTKSASLGYSTHVRVATLGRFFILLAAPMMGYMIDTGIRASSFSLIGCLSMIFVLLSLLKFYNIRNFSYLFSAYDFMNNKKSSDGVILFNPKYIKQSFSHSFIAGSCFSFILTASGVLVVNYLGTIYTDNRAMIVQMSALVTMAGTLVHSFYIDPRLSHACDESADHAYSVIRDFLFGRLVGAVMLVFIFIGLYL